MRWLKLIALFLLAAVPAMATPAYVGSAIACTSGSASTISVSYSPTAGNAVIIFVTTPGTLMTVANNLGTDYTQAVNYNTNGHIAAYLVPSEASGVTSYTATTSASTTDICITVYEASGVTNWGFIVPANSTSSGTGTVTITTQSANSILVSGFDAGTTGTVAAVTGNLRRTAQAGGVSAAEILMDNTTATAGTSLTTAASWAGTPNYAAVGIELSSNKMNVVQVISSPYAGCGGSPCSENLPLTPLGGDLGYTWADWKPTNTYTVTSVAQGTDAGAICGSVTQGTNRTFTSAVYLIPNMLAAQGTAVTWTLSGNPGASNMDVVFAEVDGAVTSSPCDATGNSVTDHAASLSMTPGSATATDALTMQMSECASNSNGGANAFTAPTGYIQLWNMDNEYDPTLLASKAVTTASALNPAWTQTASYAWTCQQTAIVGITPPPASGNQVGAFAIGP